VKSPSLKVGDRVRLLAEYRLPVPPETLDLGPVPKGSQGTVVKKSQDSIWVLVDGRAKAVPFWPPEAFPEGFAKTSSLERIDVAT
jgi:hypothetical protein